MSSVTVTLTNWERDYDCERDLWVVRLKCQACGLWTRVREIDVRSDGELAFSCPQVDCKTDMLMKLKGWIPL